jgi:LuxR family maltose regulon positive regulatory protein
MISAGTGDTDGAIAGIAEPMSALRAEDNVRFLADEGSAIVPVLEECVRSGVEPEFATRVLALIDAAAPEAAVAARREETGLSRRELEVLRLLATGLSNQEIADRLFVSLSTVKGHTTHIYEKLGANRRTDAVARAQERGLLDARPRQPEG